MKTYIFDGVEYTSLEKLLKTKFYNISLPDPVSEERLKKLNIEIVEKQYQPTEEQIFKNLKEQREDELNCLTVTVNGKIFDADEVSQQRMLNAINQMKYFNIKNKNWKLADRVESVTVDELEEALMLAVTEQDQIWMKPYNIVK